jgi:hypothetical protein
MLRSLRPLNDKEPFESMLHSIAVIIASFSLVPVLYLILCLLVDYI